MKNIVIVVHKVHTNPDNDLVIYLNKKSFDNVLHINHQFSDAKERRSYYYWYKKGKLYKKKSTIDYSFLPEPLIYFKELIYTSYWIIKSKIFWNKYIGMDGLSTNFGLLLRGRWVESVICWNLDFVPFNRFSSNLANLIYRKINLNAFSKSDEMWDHTAKMVEEKEKILGLKSSSYNKHRIVPLGVWLDRIKTYTYEDCEKDTAVFLGHLLEKQGVQLIIKAMPLIIKKVPKFKLKIIGEGNFRPKLEEQIRRAKLEKYVDFKGKIEDDHEMELVLARSCLALAPYIKNLDTFTKYGADPGKLKLYLACGLPIVLTDVSYNAKDIERNKCGLIFTEEPKDIANKIILLLKNKKINEDMRKNARDYSHQFDYNLIFNAIDF